MEDPKRRSSKHREGYNMKATGGIDGSSTQNYSFVGSPNAGNYSLSIDDVRLYLIGNPYPSALDGDQFITDNTDAIGGTLYYYESGAETSHNLGSYTGGYATYNGITGVPFGMGKTPGRYVPIGQSFFVVRDVSNSLGTGSVGSSESIVFNNAQRAFELEGANSVVFSRNNRDRNQDKLLKIGLTFDVSPSKSYHRQLAIGFVGASRNFENGLDSGMFGHEASDFYLSVEDQSGPFVIIGIEEFSIDAEIPLTVLSDQNRLMSFMVDEHLGLENQKIYLLDYEELEYYEIQDAPAEILVNTGTYTDRFKIGFKIPESLSTNDPLKRDFKIYHNNLSRSITIESSTSLINDVEVFNYLGSKVIELNNIQTDTISLSSNNLSSGIYIVRVKSDRGVIKKKIIID